MTYVVEEITSKDVTTKFGPKPAYRVKANGSWYSYGFKKPAFKVGDTIQAAVTEGKYGMEMDAASVRTIESGSAAAASPSAPPAAAPTRTYGPPAKVFPVPKDHGDRSIIRQNALTNARELVVASYGGKSFEDSDAVVHHILAVAKMFESYSSGDMDAFMEPSKEESV